MLISVACYEFNNYSARKNDRIGVVMDHVLGVGLLLLKSFYY